MGNGCCSCLWQRSDEDGRKARRKKKKPKPKPEKEQRPNPFAEDMTTKPVQVLKNVAPLRRSSLKAKYQLGEELGRGEFGITHLCTDRQTGEKFACKSISKKKLRTAVDVEDVRREVAIMASLPAHPNIVHLRAAHEDSEAVHLVMELCRGGELYARIAARGHYSERAAAAVLGTIAEVVRTCHDHGVMHRDLKPENFLFENEEESSALKVVDFGLSVSFLPGERFSEIVGSPFYMAPEVFRRNYGPEIDVWSAGVILYILLSGVPPFWAETEQGIARAILRGRVEFEKDPWPQVSDSAKNLVRRMLHPDPKRRPTAHQILQHPWLRNTKKALNIHLGEIVRVRLKQFSTMNRFKKKTMRIIAEQLSMEEVGVVREMFNLMDTNGDGRISYDELKAGLQKVGSQLDEQEMKLMMESADLDEDGQLDYREFVAITVHLQRIESDEHLRRAFEFFDKDGSGFVEAEELGEALDGDGLVGDIMREVDVDKDGRISYEEFVGMMKAGDDWRKPPRQFSRERLGNLSKGLVKEGTLVFSC